MLAINGDPSPCAFVGKSDSHRIAASRPVSACDPRPSPASFSLKSARAS